MNLPPSKAYSIGKLASQQLGNVSKNQRDLLVQLLTFWFSTGWWRVLRSCDGVTVSTANLWSDWTKLQGTGGTGGFSWIQLKHVVTGEQVLITVNTTDNSTTGYTNISVLLSPSVGFTGGTILVTPTASDSQLINNPVGGDWLGTGNGATDLDPLYRVFTWVSADGMNTRAYWQYNGHMVAWWQFDVLTNTAEPLPYPLAMEMYDVGNNYVTPAATRMRFADVFLNAISYRWVRSTDGTTMQTGCTYEAASGGAIFVDQRPKNNATGQYAWTVPVGLYKNSAGSNGGALGYYSDQWWVGSIANVPVFNDGDTADGGSFIFIGQMMLTWDGTLNPPGIASPTDYPAASFFGRDAGSCDCPDAASSPLVGPAVTASVYRYAPQAYGSRFTNP